MLRRNTSFFTPFTQDKALQSLHTGPPVVSTATTAATAVITMSADSKVPGGVKASTTNKRKMASRTRSQTEWCPHYTFPKKKNNQYAQQYSPIFTYASAFSAYRENDVCTFTFESRMAGVTNSKAKIKKSVDVSSCGSSSSSNNNNNNDNSALSPLKPVNEAVADQCTIKIRFDKMVVASRKADGVDVPREKIYKIKMKKTVKSFLAALVKRENLLRADFYELYDPVAMVTLPSSVHFNEVVSSDTDKPKFVLRLSSDLGPEEEEKKEEEDHFHNGSSNSNSNSSNDANEDSSIGSSERPASCDSGSRSSNNNNNNNNNSGCIFDDNNNSKSNKNSKKNKNLYPLLPGSMQNSTAFLLEEKGCSAVTMPGLRWISGLADKLVCGGYVSKDIPTDTMSSSSVYLPPRIEGDMSRRPVPAVIFRDTSSSMLYAKRNVTVWCHGLDEDLSSSSPTMQAYSAAARVDVISPEYLGFGVRRDEAAWCGRSVTCRDLLDDITVAVRHAIDIWDGAHYILFGRGAGADLALNFALSLYGKTGPTDWQTEAARRLLGLVVVEDPVFCKETASYVSRLGDTLNVPVLFCITSWHTPSDVATPQKMVLKLKCAYYVKEDEDSKLGWPLEKGVEFMRSVCNERKLKDNFYSFIPEVVSDSPPHQLRNVGDMPPPPPQPQPSSNVNLFTLKQDVAAFRRWLRNRGHDQMSVEMFIGSGVRTISSLATMGAISYPHSGRLQMLYTKALSEEATLGAELAAQPWSQLKTRFLYRFKTRPPKARDLKISACEVPASWKVKSDSVRNKVNHLVNLERESVPSGMTKITKK